MSANMYDDTLKIRGDINWGTNVQALIRLCFLALGDDDLLAERVWGLREVLPEQVKESEEFQKKIKACTEEWEEWVPRMVGTIECAGTVEHPLIDRKTGVQISPVRQPFSQHNPKKELGVCLVELEKLGLSWKVENETIDMGPVTKEDIPPPTPWYGEDENGNPIRELPKET